ncbi:MAG: hypothetical protein AABW47_03195 [Nanoarchaeota archaeon]
MTTELTDDFTEDEMLVRWAENSRGTIVPRVKELKVKSSPEDDASVQEPIGVYSPENLEYKF